MKEKKTCLELPHLIKGGIAIDERGQVVFANDFDFEEIKRFYMVSNHKPNFLRAWHGHKKEAKFVFVPVGKALVSAVAIDNWETPNIKAEVHQYILSAEKPAILYIPSGYANGCMTITKETQVMFFSTTTLKESAGDDFRYPFDYWNIWPENSLH